MLNKNAVTGVIMFAIIGSFILVTNTLNKSSPPQPAKPLFLANVSKGFGLGETFVKAVDGQDTFHIYFMHDDMKRGWKCIK